MVLSKSHFSIKPVKTLIFFKNQDPDKKNLLPYAYTIVPLLSCQFNPGGRSLYSKPVGELGVAH
jgi:hypothetical protein